MRQALHVVRSRTALVAWKLGQAGALRAGTPLRARRRAQTSTKPAQDRPVAGTVALKRNRTTVAAGLLASVASSKGSRRTEAPF